MAKSNGSPYWILSTDKHARMLIAARAYADARRIADQVEDGKTDWAEWGNLLAVVAI